MAKFVISRENAVALLVASGLLSASGYSDKRLAQRMQNYDELPDELKAKVKDGRLSRLQNQLLLAIARGDEVELAGEAVKEEKPAKKGERAHVIIVDDPPREKKPPPAPVMPQKRALQEKKLAERRVKDARKRREEKKREEKGPRSMPQRGVGIKEHLVGMLSEASKKNPAARDKLTASVVRTFSDRDPGRLKRTVKYYVPGYLRKMGYDVKSSPDGYWIEGSKSDGEE